jgi:acetyl-CoA carboxylase biotin carboxyl carrier protein
MTIGAQQAMSDQKSEQSTSALAASPAEPMQRHRGRRRHHNRPRHLEPSINMDELRELVGLITANDLTDFELEREGFHVKIGRNLYPQGISPTAINEPPAIAAGASARAAVQSVPAFAPSHPGALAEEAASEDQDLHIITSPIVGTFYRAPSPTAESFVRIGSKVEPETVVCIIEAMKLMNEIQAETTGEVVKIYVENGQAVEYGQPLFGIRTQ